MSKNGKSRHAVDVSLPDLPDSWCWATILDLCRTDRNALKAGPFGSNLKKSSYVETGYKIYGQEQVIRGDPSYGDYYVNDEKYESLESCAVSPRDLLISLVGTIGRTLILPDDSEPGIINPRLIKVSLNEDVSLPEFVQLYLQSQHVRQIFKLVSHGGTMEILNMGTLKALAFPIPPLAEQRRIVAKIEELFSDLDAGVAALERAKANLKRYRAAVLKAAVEGKLTAAWRAENACTESASDLLQRILHERRQKWEEQQIAKYAEKGKQPPKNWRDKYKPPAAPDTTNLPNLPTGWCCATVDQLSHFVTSGSRGWAKYYADSGAIFIRAQDINTDRLVLNGIAHVNAPQSAEGVRTRSQRDDLLVTITGANVTKTALVDCDLDEAYVSQHVALVRPVDRLVTPYMHIWITCPTRGRRELERLAYGAGKPGLNLDNIRELNIALPPLEEQRQIKAECDRLLSIGSGGESHIARSVKRSARLRQSILKRAFEGKLVPQDPTDEPASELFARIEVERKAMGSTAKKTTK